MENCFACITPNWLNRAYLFNGSIGKPFHDFRYRLEQDAKEKTVRASTYADVCYEAAEDVRTETFSWDDEGVEKLKNWLQQQYEDYLSKRGTD